MIEPLDALLDEMVKAEDEFEAPTPREVLQFLIRMAKIAKRREAREAREELEAAMEKAYGPGGSLELRREEALAIRDARERGALSIEDLYEDD